MIDERDLEHFRRLDVHRWSEHPEVNEFVSRIIKDHFSRPEDTARADTRKGIRNHVKVLLLDLYVAWANDPDQCISVPRSPSAYEKGGRYNKLYINKRMIDVMDRLLAAGLIDEKRGFRDPDTGVGKTTRIWPTPQLIKMFADARFGPLDIDTAPDRECIILRDKVETPNRKKPKTVDVGYEDTPETQRMRASLQAYNALLRRTFIDIPELEKPVIERLGDSGKLERFVISQSDKFVRRIFSRGSWDLNGRFHGGWWQRVPSDWRKKIWLDDEPCAEEDYSSLHPIMLYAEAGVSYWDTREDDPYQVEFDLAGDSKEARGWAKKLLLTAINAKSEEAAFDAFRYEMPKGSLGKKLKDTQLRRLLDALKEKHPVIADRFCQDQGIRLMNKDAKITEEIIEAFTRYGVPILTVHDSYVVPMRYRMALVKNMEFAFQRVMGVGRPRMKTANLNREEYELLTDRTDGTGLRMMSTEAFRSAEEIKRREGRRAKGYARRYERFCEWRRENAEALGIPEDEQLSA